MNLFGKFKQYMAIMNISGSFYRKSLSIVLLITCLPSAVIAISFYFIGIGQIQKEVDQTHKTQIEQIYNRITEQFSQLELTVNKWAITPAFNDEIRNMDVKTDFTILNEMYQTFSIMQSADDLISNVNFYLQPQNVLISSVYGVNKVRDPKEEKFYSDLLLQKGIYFWVDSPEATNSSDNTVPVLLIHKVPFRSGEPYGVLIVSLDKKQIDDIITQLNPGDQGASFILKQNGDWITTGRSASKGAQSLDTALKDDVMKRGGKSGSFIYKWGGEDYSVSFDTFSHTDWKCIIASPLLQFTSPISMMSKLILLVSLAGLAIAFLLSWLASRSIYKPVKRLVNLFGSDSNILEIEKKDEIGFIENQWSNITRESKLLQERLEQNQEYLKEGFFLQLVQGFLYFHSEAELRKQMEQYDWYVDESGFIILLFRMIFTSGPHTGFSEGDDQLITFAAANIISELSGDIKDNAVVINFHDLSVALLVKFPKDLPLVKLKSDIYHRANLVIDALYRHLRLNVTVGISKPVVFVRDIARAMEETRNVLRFRDIEEKGQILDVDEFIPVSQDSQVYPLNIDKEITQAVMMGDEEEVTRKIRKFLDYLKDNAGKELIMQQSAMQLLGSILQVIAVMGLDVNSIYNGSNLYEQLSRLRGTDEMLKWFETNVIKPYLKKLAETQGIQMKRLVQKVIETIECKYMTDISLESCADMHGTHSKRLSAVFVQVTGKNFIDYLTDFRMEKAKQLLRETSDKINDIAVQVGYQPSYFNRRFKLHEGITPGEFREMHQH